jgi:hypothetical protein
VLKNGAPDCLVCQRTVSGAPGRTVLNQLLSGIPGRALLKLTGLSGASAKQRLSSANGRLQKASIVNSANREVRAHKLEGTGLSGVAPDCPVPQEDKASNNRQAQNRNG